MVNPETIKPESRKEKVEVEKEPLLWETLAMRDEARQIESYESETKLNKDTKKEIDSIFLKEADQARIDFAKEWFKENSDKVENKGYNKGIDIDDKKNEGYILKITSELEGFNELKKEGKYQEAKERIDNLYALKIDLQKEKIPIDSQFLMLNTLNKRAERLEDEISKIGDQKKGSPEFLEKEALEREKKELFQLRKELSESITGRDLEKEVKGKMKPSKKEEKENMQNMLQALNYRTEETGWMMKKTGIGIEKKIQIINKDRNTTVSELKNEKEVNEFLKNELVERKIRTLGKSPEKAEGGIEKVYTRAKKRLKNEFIEKDLKKEEKTKEQLEQIKKEFEKEGKNPAEFIDAILQRKGPLGELTKDWKDKNNRTRINEFLEDWGISIDSDDMNYRLKNMGERGRTYERVITKEKDFIEWLIELIFESPKQKK